MYIFDITKRRTHESYICIRKQTNSCGASETPIEAGYNFTSTQDEMDALNDKIAKLRHGINVFNTTTKLE